MCLFFFCDCSDNEQWINTATRLNPNGKAVEREHLVIHLYMSSDFFGVVHRSVQR